MQSTKIYFAFLQYSSCDINTNLRRDVITRVYSYIMEAVSGWSEPYALDFEEINQ